MTPSQQAKAAGLKSLAVVQEMTGQSAQTLINWAKNKPELFQIVLIGCKAARTKNEESSQHVSECEEHICPTCSSTGWKANCNNCIPY